MKTLTLFALGCCSLACAAGAASGGGPSPAGAELPASADHALVGAPAPEFSLPVQGEAGGAELGLASAASKVRLIDFWATWCEPCRLSFPKYQELQQRYGERIAILAISEDDDAQGIDAFRHKTGVSFPLLWDQDKSVAKSFSVEAMPTLFIVDENGLVRQVHTGFRPGDEAQIDAVLQSLLK